MTFRPLILSDREPADPHRSRPQAYGEAGAFLDMNDPRIVDFMRQGSQTSSGACVNTITALGNTAVWRSVSLISYAIGMLPLQLIDEETKEKATTHPLYVLLHREPNGWQTAFDFRVLMQMRALVKGNAYAKIVRVGKRVVGLIPIDPDKVTPTQNADFTVSYKYQTPNAGQIILAPEEVFHLRGLTLDGINGIALVFMAREAIGLALAAERTTGRVFKNGSFVDGVLSTKGRMTEEAYNRLRSSWNERYTGADNAGKTPLLEEDTTYASISSSPKDAQAVETRKLQIEEIARVFGIPRPLLMVDETSWGSGVEALGRFFVQHALNPWFEAWQQAIERSLLVGAEKSTLSAKFNPAALLRGSTTDQANFFGKALGAGGAPGWMTPNEVRDTLDMPAHPDGDKLPGPSAAPDPTSGDGKPDDEPPPPGDPTKPPEDA